MTRSEAAKILGISPKADKKAVKKAFRKKAMQLHPDRNKSDNARSEFIQAHEAYEYLNDLLSGRIKESYSSSKRTKYTNTRNSKFRATHHRHRTYYDPYADMSSEDFEKRYERARKAAAEHLDRESEQIYQNALDEYQNTWRKPVAKFMAVIGLLLASIFIIDFSFGVTEHQLERSEVIISTDFKTKPHTHYFTIKGHKYKLPSKLNYIYELDKIPSKIVIDGVSYPIPVEIVAESFDIDKLKYSYYQTSIFKDITAIRLQGNKFDEQIGNFRSVYGSFPFIPLLLLIPFISFWFEKATFNFVFFIVNYNIYIIPIFVLILLFHDGRIYRIFA